MLIQNDLSFVIFISVLLIKRLIDFNLNLLIFIILTMDSGKNAF